MPKYVKLSIVYEVQIKVHQFKLNNNLVLMIQEVRASHDLIKSIIIINRIILCHTGHVDYLSQSRVSQISEY
jgi:hypothetical protein